MASFLTPTPSPTPRAVEEDCGLFSASSSTGQGCKNIKIFGVFIDIPTSSMTGAVDETIEAAISTDTQGSVVQPVDNGHGDDDYWKIKKTLTYSDVDGSSRLLLGKRLVKDHVLPNVVEFDGERGTELTVYDVDTRTVHTVLLKTWKTTSYVLVKGWMGGFVRRRVLRRNDEIGLRWEETHGRFEFSLLRRYAPRLGEMAD